MISSNRNIIEHTGWWYWDRIVTGNAIDILVYRSDDIKTDCNWKCYRIYRFTEVMILRQTATGNVIEYTGQEKSAIKTGCNQKYYRA